jgi:uncharacterized membrane protein YgcG
MIVEFLIVAVVAAVLIALILRSRAKAAQPSPVTASALSVPEPKYAPYVPTTANRTASAPSNSDRAERRSTLATTHTGIRRTGSDTLSGGSTRGFRSDVLIIEDEPNEPVVIDGSLTIANVGPGTVIDADVIADAIAASPTGDVVIDKGYDDRDGVYTGRSSYDAPVDVVEAPISNYPPSNVEAPVPTTYTEDYARDTTPAAGSYSGTTYEDRSGYTAPAPVSDYTPSYGGGSNNNDSYGGSSDSGGSYNNSSSDYGSGSSDSGGSTDFGGGDY